MNEKIYITGTGRCGTTFLIKLFTFLNFNTGFNELNYSKHIHKNCNSGMEKQYYDNFNVIKNPTIIQNIKKIIDDKINIKYIIIPIRDYNKSAESRVLHNNKQGGLWNASNETEQILFYNKILSEYLFYMVKYDIPTIFLDFDRMINDKKYLFEKIQNILNEKNIDFNIFSQSYDNATLSSKPKPEPEPEPN